MLFISHRGNLNGPIPERENSPDYIDEANSAGFMAEVDIKVIDDQVILGHGEQSYPVSWQWLSQRSERLLLHLKNREAVRVIPDYWSHFRYFCNEKDEFSFTSSGFILCWSKHPNRYGWGSKYMLPLIDLADIEQYDEISAGAVISDYPLKCKEKFG